MRVLSTSLFSSLAIFTLIKEDKCRGEEND